MPQRDSLGIPDGLHRRPVHRVRHHPDRRVELRDASRQDLRHERRGHPDLVGQLGAGTPLRRDHGQLPRPVGNDRHALQRPRIEQRHRPRELRRIDMHHHLAGLPGCQHRQVSARRGLQVGHDRQPRRQIEFQHRNAPRAQVQHHQLRPSLQSAARAEQPGHHDPGAGRPPALPFPQRPQPLVLLHQGGIGQPRLLRPPLQGDAQPVRRPHDQATQRRGKPSDNTEGQGGTPPERVATRGPCPPSRPATTAAANARHDAAAANLAGRLPHLGADATSDTPQPASARLRPGTPPSHPGVHAPMPGP